jgi:8-oxo-dGTP diphosphatase
MIERVPCVAAILYNSESKLLLQQRDEKAGLNFAGYWTLFGGRVEADESPEAAIKRELLEEIEVKPALNFWKVYDRKHKQSVVIEQYIFTGEINQSADEITLNEGQALGFFDKDELQRLKIAFGFQILLQEFFNLLLVQNAQDCDSLPL